MDVLVVTPWLPSPRARAGAPRAIHDRVALLARHHAVTVAAIVDAGDRSSIGDLERVGATVATVERPARRPSARATWGKRVRLAVGLVADRRPMLVQELADARLCELVRRLTEDRAFDVVFVEHLLAAPYVECLTGRAASRVVLTDHDVRVAFPDADERPLTDRPNRARRAVGRIDQRRWRAYARRAYASAALVTVPTAEDAAAITGDVPAGRLEVVPFGIVPPEPAPASGSEAGSTSPALPAEDSVLFVGSFDHAPNRDAAGWLCSAVMPLVQRRHPGATLWLVGRDPTPDVVGLAGPRVIVTGEVPSVGPYLGAATVFVAPVRDGGGIRIKTLEALAAGAAVVTTSVGARGLDARPGEHLLVADEPDGIADAIVRVLEDPALRARLIAAGRALAGDGDARVRRAAALDRVVARVAARPDAADEL